MTPLAIFAFRRPDHLRALLASVAKCRRLEECAITIFCDGPRGPDDADAVQAARTVAREWAAAQGAQIVERAENLGLARSIVTAVTELVNAHGRVIVVEDDMILSPDFLDFILMGLDRYEHDERALQITGFQFALEPLPKADAFFIPLASTWGWATWRRAWQHFRWQPENPERLEDSATRDRFNLEGAYPYSTLLKNRLEGRNDSWGILWYWAVFQADGLVVFPRESLVNVGGADGSGTHCNTRHHDAGPQQLGRMRGSEVFVWPGDVACDEAEWRAIKRCMAGLRRAAESVSFFQKVRTRLGSALRAGGLGKSVGVAKIKPSL